MFNFIGSRRKRGGAKNTVDNTIIITIERHLAEHIVVVGGLSPSSPRRPKEVGEKAGGTETGHPAENEGIPPLTPLDASEQSIHAGGHPLGDALQEARLGAPQVHPLVPEAESNVLRRLQLLVQKAVRRQQTVAFTLEVALGLSTH